MNTSTIEIPKVKTYPEVMFGSQKKRVGLLGGTFNPLHNGHLIVAQQVLSQLGLEKIVFLPDNLPPHVDHKDALPAKQRLEMVRLGITGNEKFELDTTEIERGGVSYTVDTIKDLQARHPDTDYYFIIGGDMVEYLPKWYQIDQLVRMVKFVGVKRTGARTQSQYPLLWVDVPTIDISSTLIREKVQQGCSIKYLVPSAVEDYIKEEGLYRD
ncbi:nicotinic acid mononucleotide adenylyltransferase [Ligilactobacillus salitolerans]|uniref:Probable nicotinate-nucleotide adenylyltransferase n=1 Tax=Ligilactobacillus salitolerans TaxID=1808352 RepID=A0A401IVS8_9LACO|nr:nicotinic acid mononucleotide adenylyltransferase [Ligilactobacillus salitolerans]